MKDNRPARESDDEIRLIESQSSAETKDVKAANLHQISTDADIVLGDTKHIQRETVHLNSTVE